MNLLQTIPQLLRNEVDMLFVMNTIRMNLSSQKTIEGEDCGINFKGDVTIMEGDTLEFYKMVQRK